MNKTKVPSLVKSQGAVFMQIGHDIIQSKINLA